MGQKNIIKNIKDTNFPKSMKDINPYIQGDQWPTRDIKNTGRHITVKLLKPKSSQWSEKKITFKKATVRVKTDLSVETMKTCTQYFISTMNSFIH